MNLRHATALALVGWYLLMPLGTQRCVADADGLAEASNDDYAELKLEQDKMQAVCDDPANNWILKLPHVSALAHWLPTSDQRFADALDKPGRRRNPSPSEC